MYNSGKLEDSKVTIFVVANPTRRRINPINRKVMAMIIDDDDFDARAVLQHRKLSFTVI
jgi:hypothetical protein